MRFTKCTSGLADSVHNFAPWQLMTVQKQSPVHNLKHSSRGAREYETVVLNNIEFVSVSICRWCGERKTR